MWYPTTVIFCPSLGDLGELQQLQGSDSFFFLLSVFFLFFILSLVDELFEKKGNKTKDRIGLSAKTSCSSHLCLHIFRSYLIADFEELMNVTNALKCMNRNQRIISD